MSKDDRERIEDVYRDLKDCYGPVLSRRDLAELLKMRATSADRWAAQRGLAARRVAAGQYASRDVARAMVLGCV